MLNDKIISHNFQYIYIYAFILWRYINNYIFSKHDFVPKLGPKVNTPDYNCKFSNPQ